MPQVARSGGLGDRRDRAGLLVLRVGDKPARSVHICALQRGEALAADRVRLQRDRAVDALDEGRRAIKPEAAVMVALGRDD